MRTFSGVLEGSQTCTLLLAATSSMDSCMYVCMSVSNVYAYMHACICIYVYRCICVCIYVYEYIDSYLHISISCTYVWKCA